MAATCGLSLYQNDFFRIGSLLIFASWASECAIAYLRPSNILYKSGPNILIAVTRTYMWGVVYLRCGEPSIWADTAVKMFSVQRV